MNELPEEAALPQQVAVTAFAALVVLAEAAVDVMAALTSSARAHRRRAQCCHPWLLSHDCEMMLLVEAVKPMQREGRMSSA